MQRPHRYRRLYRLRLMQRTIRGANVQRFATTVGACAFTVAVLARRAFASSIQRRRTAGGGDWLARFEPAHAALTGRSGTFPEPSHGGVPPRRWP